MTLNEPARWSPDMRLRSRFQSIIKEYPENIPAKVDVLCSANESAIINEILARHSGTAGGVGQLDWEAFMRTIFLVSHELPAEYKRPGQYALWGEENGIEVPDEFPISSLQRFFTKENLKLLGFNIDHTDKLVPNMREDVVKKMAATVLGDFASSRVKVSDVFETSQSTAYINSVREMYGVSNSSQPSAPQPTTQNSAGSSHSAAAAPPPNSPASPSTPYTAPEPIVPTAPRATSTPRTAPHDRKRMFGSGSPNIGIPASETKASAIVVELRKLDLTETPLAAAVLLRALIELSSEYYRKANGLPENKLAKSVKRCAEHMLTRSMLTQSEIDITMRLCDTIGSLIQIESLQKMVHRDTHNLDKQFVNTFWDNIAPFIRACWR